MRRRWAKRAGLLVAGLLLVAGCVPGGSVEDNRPGSGSASRMMDQNQNKIFDSLEATLATAPEGQKVPVLILAEGRAELAEAQKAAGDIDVKYRYDVVPAMAASVTREQVAVLAQQEGIRQIELDAEVRVALDGANRWFGTAQARTDFGVTGDRDGQPSYSKNDIVRVGVD